METSLDKFFGGKISLLQPKSGFRAGTDTVMMSAAVPISNGENVLELGSGAGVALCCLGARVRGIELYGIEIQPMQAELAQQNLSRSGLNGEIICADVFDLPKPIFMRQFDHVMINPPFFETSAHSAPQNNSKSIAHIATAPLQKWIEVGRKRLRAKGSITIIQRASALVEILSALDGFGDIRILPIAAKQGKDAKTIIVQARYQTAGATKILSPFITHDLENTETPQLRAITYLGNHLQI